MKRKNTIGSNQMHNPTLDMDSQLVISRSKNITQSTNWS